MNFEFWINCKLSKSAKIWQVKNHPNLSQFFFFFHWRIIIISFGYVDSYAKIFLILSPPLENSTTRIAIMFTNLFWVFSVNTYSGHQMIQCFVFCQKATFVPNWRFTKTRIYQNRQETKATLWKLHFDALTRRKNQEINKICGIWKW